MGPIILACVILFSSACANPATDKPKAVVVTPATEAQSPRPAEAETLLITPANSKIEFTGSSPKEANHGSFRKFAGQIELSPAEYAEAEAGVVRWLGEEQETLIPQILGLSPLDRRQFLAMLAKARADRPLEFKDIFTREQLEPVRLRHAKGKQTAAHAKKEILDAVFAPLK